MRIQEVMTVNPSWCVPGDLSAQAARIMKDKNIGIVPIVKSRTDRTLIGVVTDRDLCLGVVATDKSPSAVRVEQCMTTNIIVCQPEEDVQRAADLMHENQVRRIPVVDHQGVLQGMVSTADICQRSNLSSDATHSIFKKVTEPTNQASKPRATMMQTTA